MQYLVESGDLPAAVPASAQLAQVLDATPRPLSEAAVTSDIRVRSLVPRHGNLSESTPQSKLRVLTNRIEELLNNAYTQSVVVSSTDIIIRHFVLGWFQDFVLAIVDSDIYVSSSSKFEEPHTTVCCGVRALPVLFVRTYDEFAP